jgi:hypothetical protein
MAKKRKRVTMNWIIERHEAFRKTNRCKLIAKMLDKRVMDAIVYTDSTKKIVAAVMVAEELCRLEAGKRK